MNFLDPRLPDRFWSKCAPDANTGCWLWTASTNYLGYGEFARGGRSGNAKAHRHAYLALVGPIADGLVLDHLCRVRSCCNPAHLEPVTGAENMRRGITATKTHCKHGHEFSEANTRIKPKGAGLERACIACAIALNREYRARRKTREAVRAQTGVRP